MSKKRTWVIGVVIAAAISAAFCWHVLSKMKPQYWDFSTSRSLDQVPWPRANTGDYVDEQVESRVTIDLPGGHRVEQNVYIVTFTRRGDHISAIVLNCEPQTTDDVYANALSLAAQWNLSTASLDSWYKWAKSHPVYGPGIPPHALAMGSGLVPGIAVEIFHSYDNEKPFKILFEVTWLEGAPP